MDTAKDYLSSINDCITRDFIRSIAYNTIDLMKAINTHQSKIIHLYYTLIDLVQNASKEDTEILNSNISILGKYLDVLNTMNDQMAINFDLLLNISKELENANK